MKLIRTVTLEPVRVPLSGDKVLHLGPSKDGEVAEETLERPAFRKLVDRGVILIVGDGSLDDPDYVEAAHPRQATHGHLHATNIKPSGDR